MSKSRRQSQHQGDGTRLESIQENRIERIVARLEAPDSGPHAASPENWPKFASSLLNLTLPSHSVDRHQKSDKDTAELLPDLNQCCHLDSAVQVRLEYVPTISVLTEEALTRSGATRKDLHQERNHSQRDAAHPAETTPSVLQVILGRQKFP